MRKRIFRNTRNAFCVVKQLQSRSKNQKGNLKIKTMMAETQHTQLANNADEAKTHVTQTFRKFQQTFRNIKQTF